MLNNNNLYYTDQYRHEIMIEQINNFRAYHRYVFGGDSYIFRQYQYDFLMLRKQALKRLLGANNIMDDITIDNLKKELRLIRRYKKHFDSRPEHAMARIVKKIVKQREEESNED